MWRRKIQEYLHLYYQGDKKNALNTTFFYCMSKVEALDELLISRHDDFRGVKDAQGILQSACIIEITQIYIDDESYTGLGIESLTNAPWNTIPYPQSEATKGCATSLIEELVRESQRLQFNGIVKAITIPSARRYIFPRQNRTSLEKTHRYTFKFIQTFLNRCVFSHPLPGVLLPKLGQRKSCFVGVHPNPFYRKIGFIETDGSGEMILTCDAALIVFNQTAAIKGTPP